MYDVLPPERDEPVTLYTDSHRVRGMLRTRLRRISDVLNETEASFLVLEDVTVDTLGRHELTARAPYAQINLDSVLFAVGGEVGESPRELRSLKIAEQALILMTPFTIVGRIHVLPDSELASALQTLRARFVPVTVATFWSESVGEPRTEVSMLACNQSRAQILAPFVMPAGAIPPPASAVGDDEEADAPGSPA